MFDKFATPQLELWNTLRNLIIEASRHHILPFPFLIGIGGAGCMGKTNFAIELFSYPPQGTALLFDLDGYLIPAKERDEKKLTGYNPESYNFEKAEKVFYSILKGNKTIINSYNHVTRKPEIINITNTLKINTIIIEGVHSNTKYFSPYKFYSLKINFIPEDDSVHENSRTTVELYTRNRENVNLIDWRDRLKKHNEDYDEFLLSSINSSDINVVISNVNQFDRPTISELRYRYNNKLITKKLHDYNIEIQVLNEDKDLLDKTSFLLSFISKYSSNTELIKNLKKELDEYNKGNISSEKKSSIKGKFRDLLKKENLEKGSIVVTIIAKIIAWL